MYDNGQSVKLRATVSYELSAKTAVNQTCRIHNV